VSLWLPTVLKCRCGHVLAEWDTLPSEDYSGTYYHKIFSAFGGKCPKCGRGLPRPEVFSRVMSVEVKPVQ